MSDVRLNLRIDKDLKEWFKNYSSTRGGMSHVLKHIIARLKRKDEERSEVKDESENPTSA